MTKNQKKENDSVYFAPIQQRNTEKEERKKNKTRAKRIKQSQKKKEEKEGKFDLETETVIAMTNRNNQKKQQETQQKNKQEQKKKMKKQKRMKTILKVVTLLFLLTGATIFAFVSPIFNVQEIEVLQNNQVSKEEILSLSGLQVGQNLFQFRTSQVKKAIQENAYIDMVKITRKIPNKIQISVVEREKKFSLEFLNGYAYLNNQGYILEISNDQLDLPILQGASTPEEKIVAGERLEKEDLEKLGMVIQIMDACKTCELDNKVTSIDMNNKSEYSIYIEEEKKTIYLGEASNLSNKMLWVQAIMEDNKGKEGEIFVNGDLNNKFKPRFREKVKI